MVPHIILWCEIVLSVCASQYYLNNSYSGHHISIINITNVMNITNEMSLPVRLDVIEEINIKLTQNQLENRANVSTQASESNYQKQDHYKANKTTYNIENFGYNLSASEKTEEHQGLNKTTYNIENFKNNISAGNPQTIQNDQSQNQTIKCCLVIFPPRCDTKQCIIQRKKMCWNVCTQEIVILEAPGFPRDKFPKAFIPPNWKNEQFLENITISLDQRAATPSGYEQRSFYTNNGYQQPTLYWPQAPYPYQGPQNVARQRFQYNANVVPYQIGYPFYQRYVSQPPVYWCPGPYCPVVTPPYY